MKNKKNTETELKCIMTEHPTTLDTINKNPVFPNHEEVIKKLKKENDDKRKNEEEKLLAEFRADTLEEVDEIQKTRNEFWSLFMQRNETGAIEAIVQAFIKKHSIYTTRNDKNPEVWIYHKGIYVPHGQSRICEFVRIILQDRYKLSIVNQAISKIIVDSYVDEDLFFNTNYIELLPVENGILNVVTKELSPFTPKKIFFAKLPVTFDTKAKCPKIMDFLNSIQTEDNIPLLQEISGYALYKDYFIHKWFLFHGGGRNGKGAFIRLLESLIGRDNCKNIAWQNLEEDRFSIAELHGRLINCGGDIPARKLKETSKMKGLTGGDKISADRKFLRPLNFTSYAKQIHSANTIPDVDDTSDGFFDRLGLINFPFKFVDKFEYDKAQDKTKLRIKNDLVESTIKTPDELSGFLNFALNGLDRLLKNRKFTYTPSCDEVKGQYLRKSDNIIAFVSDCFEKDFTGYVTKDEFRELYSNYCRDNHLVPKSERDIKNTLLTKLGLYDKQKMIPVEGMVSDQQSFESVRCWFGIKIKK